MKSFVVDSRTNYNNKFASFSYRLTIDNDLNINSAVNSDLDLVE